MKTEREERNADRDDSCSAARASDALMPPKGFPEKMNHHQL